MRDTIKKDEHQSFIDLLPKDSEDKLFMQIDHWARESYKRHQSSVRGQVVTSADSYESHIIWATLRWAKENTPPAAPVQEPDHGDELAIAYMNGVHRGKELAAQRQWVGLTQAERHDIREWQKIQEELGPVWSPMMLYLYDAIEAKLKEKNT
jgi:hypothetical protein